MSVPICRWSPELWIEVGRMQNADGSSLLGCLGRAFRASITCLFVATTPRESTTKPVPMISGNCGGCLRTNLDANATIDGRTSSNALSKEFSAIRIKNIPYCRAGGVRRCFSYRTAHKFDRPRDQNGRFSNRRKEHCAGIEVSNEHGQSSQSIFLEPVRFPFFNHFMDVLGSFGLD